MYKPKTPSSMKITKYESEAEWLAARPGKITGSSLSSVVSSGSVGKAQLQAALTEKGVEFKKADTIATLSALFKPEEISQMEIAAMIENKKEGYWQLVADRLSVQPDKENPMDRGHRLEPVAIEAYKEITKREIVTDLVIWERDDSVGVALSPDGYELVEDKIPHAVEVKCLASWKHVKAKVTQQIPDDYHYQKLQYFIVNDNLETLDFVFHNPLFVPELQTHIITVKREDVQAEIDKLLAYQREVIKDVNALVMKLSI